MTTFRILLVAVLVLYGLVFFGVRSHMKSQCPDNYVTAWGGGYCQPNFADICAENGGTLIEIDGQQACAGVK